MKTLSELHDSENLILTAHRGASFDRPENTAAAFQHAVECHADFIEFDLRMSADGIPVVLHDRTIDRTSDGTGTPESHTLKELQTYNFSRYCREARLDQPMYPDLTIPAFEEVLQKFRDKVCMNIQTYASLDGMKEICRLYLEYDMTDRGYLTIADMAAADYVRSYSRDIQICLTPGWNERALPENLKKCADYGCRFVQPVIESVTPETFELCRKLGLRANVFFSDSPEQVAEYQKMGLNGIMTNRIPLLSAFFK